MCKETLIGGVVNSELALLCIATFQLRMWGLRGLSEQGTISLLERAVAQLATRQTINGAQTTHNMPQNAKESASRPEPSCTYDMSLAFCEDQSTQQNCTPEILLSHTAPGTWRTSPAPATPTLRHHHCGITPSLCKQNVSCEVCYWQSPNTDWVATLPGPFR